MKSTIFAACLLLMPVILTASHSVGGEVTVECLGNDQYKVSLSFYRDCEGIDAPGMVWEPNPVVYIKSSSCNVSKSITLSLVSYSDISPICAELKTTCEGGSYNGVEEYIYENTITLTDECADWVFSYEICCRNSIISTVKDPGYAGMYVYTDYDNLNYGCNSSPQFDSPPLPFVCIGEEYCFNVGATDPDGDSLSYHFTTPKETSSSNVTFLSGYSASSPLTSSSGMDIDAETGDICFTSTKSEVGIMAIKVKEWRDGVLIGYVVRDIQLTTTDCGNELPYTTGINNTYIYKDTIPASCEYCFTTKVKDDDADDQLTITWDSGISGATFDNTTNNSAEFCWTPKLSQKSKEHCFTVEVKDDACPYNGIQQFTYCLLVSDQLVVDIDGPDDDIACGATTELVALPSGGTSPYSYSWDHSNAETDSIVNVEIGTYNLTLSDASGCSVDESFMVTSPTVLIDLGEDYSIDCGDSTTLLASGSGGSGTYTYLWNSGEVTPTLKAKTTAEYSVIIDDGENCFAYDTITVTVNEGPEVVIDNFNNCEAEVQLSALASKGTGNFTYLWNTLETSQYITAIGGQYIVSVDDGTSCYDEDTITFYPKPSTDFSFENVCLEEENSFINLSDIAFGSIDSWTWEFDDNLESSSTDSSASFLYADYGTYNVSLIAYSDYNCTDTIKYDVVVYPKPTAYFSADNVCLNQISSFIDNSTVPNSAISDFYWNIGDENYSVDANPSYVFSNFGTYDVSLVVTSDDGCKDTLEQSVTIYPLPEASFDYEKVCLNEITLFDNLSTINSAYTLSEYEWDFDDINSTTVSTETNPEFTYSESGMHNVELIAITNVGCADTLIKEVEVYYLPEVSFESDVTEGCKPLKVNFSDISSIESGTNVSWNWVINGYDFYQEEVEYIFEEEGFYSIFLTVTSDQNCISSDSIIEMIEVYPKPTALFDFTPNNDISIFNSKIKFENLSKGDTYWDWDMGDDFISYEENVTHTYEDTGMYIVELISFNDYGCSDTLIQNIYIAPDWSLYIPNTFTPNSDTKNDAYNAKGWGVLEYNMQIFDRWGNLLFASNSLAASWDGNYSGEPAMEGKYIYLISTKDIDNKLHRYMGEFTLLR